MPFHSSLGGLETVTSARYEKKREREFYMYYEPIRMMSGDAQENFTDVNSPQAVLAHRACSSPDTALTAFCQLVAVRLHMKRAMLFFFDSDHAYILAEATRTLSLRRDSLHEVGDDLWLGRTVIPRGVSVCEETTVLGEANTLHIIPNLAEDTRFCDRPYVKGGPKARVLDDEPHEGLDEKGVDLMQEMAVTIMEHLEMVRLKAEHRRLSNMTTGLADFVREAGSKYQNLPTTTARKGSRGRSGMGRPVSLSEATRRPKPSESVATTMPTSPSVLPLKKQAEELATGRTPHFAPPRKEKFVRTVSPTKDSHPPSGIGRPANTNPNENDDDERYNFRDQTIRATMNRAAALIRTALDADGVLYPDASLLGFGRSSGNTMPGMETDTDQTASENDSRKQGVSADDPVADNNSCLILGSSIAAPASGQQAEKAPVIPHRLMQSVLKYHGTGKIWNFSPDVEDYSDGASTEGPVGKSGSSTSVVKKETTRAALGKTLADLFPKVRSLMLLGLWDPVRAKWSSLCIVWSLSPKRVFSVEEDLNYVQVWNDIITAQLGRLEVELDNKAKSDFISSISHELRSPLHGILGTVELLREEVNDPTVSSMVDAIDVSGRTLSDIVESLLGYSKINSTIRKSRSRTSFLTRKKSGIQLDADVELATLTEEVVESAVYSYGFRVKAAQRVTTILDIDRSYGVSWRCRIAIGAWKRVCINLVQNALKYTNEGHIIVSLKMLPASGAKRRSSALLTIADSGKGMSREFLEHQLFRAFTQEDDLTEGTGLGMSMVAKIVKGLGGEIRVQSEKDRGTVVSVTVPLETSAYDKKLAAEELEVQRSALTLAVPDVLVDFLGSPSQESGNAMATAHKLQISTLRKSCKESLKLSLELPSWTVSTKSTLAMILEADVSQLLQVLQSEPDDPIEKAAIELLKSRPLVIICKDYLSARRIKTSPIHQSLGVFECISQPCGPQRLGIAFRKCLDSIKGGRRPTASLSRGGSSDSLPPEAIAIEDAMTETEGEESDLPLPRLTISWEARKGSEDLNEEHKETTSSQAIAIRVASERSKPTVPSIPKIATKQPSSSTAIPNPTTQKPELSPDPPKLPLLLVDDNAINLQILTAYARKHGHKFALAHDGLEALEAYKAAAHPDAADLAMIAAASTPYSSGARLVVPSVILLDMTMPIMSGFEAARHIRAFERKHDIKPVTIIALTGLGSAEAVREASQSGINLYLTKPVRLKELTKLLKDIQEGVVLKMDEE